MTLNCLNYKKNFTKQRNLKRHIKEIHQTSRFLKCVYDDCAAKCIRRSNLVQHIHKLSIESKKFSSKAQQHPVTYNGQFSDISDDDSSFDLVAELDELWEGYEIPDTTVNILDDIINDEINNNFTSTIENGDQHTHIEKSETSFANRRCRNTYSMLIILVLLKPLTIS